MSICLLDKPGSRKVLRRYDRLVPRNYAPKISELCAQKSEIMRHENQYYAQIMHFISENKTS
jgi:hypothetical protein